MKTLALLLAIVAQCPPGARNCPAPVRCPAVCNYAAVRVDLERGASRVIGSGTVVAVSDGQALVLTVRHLFAEGTDGRLVITNGTDWSREGSLIALDDTADLAAISIPALDWMRSLELADSQPSEAVMVGYCGGRKVGGVHPGRIRPRRLGDSVVYSFPSREGDSGGGVYDTSGRLAGVVWGRSPSDGVVTPIATVRRFLGDGRLARWLSPGAGLKIKAKRGSSVNIGDVAVSPAQTPASPPMPPEAPPGPVGPRGPQGPPGPTGPAADVAALEARIKALEEQIKRPINFVTVNPDGTRISKPVPLGGSIGIKIPQPK